tara:strand:- start:3 stop:191 length:189 start_codon:yes stop_codon:yes gene_type:complete
MVEDKLIWNGVKERITSKMSNQDFKIMCRLHAKYFNHTYQEICTCNKKRLRQWIFQLNDKLI